MYMAPIIDNDEGREALFQAIGEGPRACSFVTYVTYLDDRLSEPVCFETVRRGTLSSIISNGQKMFVSKIFYMFIPNGEDKTLADMTREEKVAYHKKRTEPSAAEKFAVWMNSQDETTHYIGR